MFSSRYADHVLNATVVQSAFVRVRERTVLCNYNERILQYTQVAGCVVECRIYHLEVARSNLGRDYFAPRCAQPSISLGSVNECQLRLGRQMQVLLILIAGERVSVQVKL